ncbi:hypothetical protein BCR33DRAFT_713453 [Rhizoclosmatium globosum]|uniref:Uncharacterized protein n=1 Tax=Rhizoclosmatium globosum TaxID=329046 RepID=A0A1Y2CSL4_9FUNG|nr:hypothetical protein BCR33DRAFT_713453 [Rhizoclosmatium globosum]|eukprot:ORY49854.1 hypothetical protein BCR33DRAFT_713453 [Rhizoclosmatium globosum]
MLNITNLGTNNLCFTAVDTTQPTPGFMLLNQYYKVRFSFPNWFSIGPQPFRAPLGTVTCKSPVIGNQTQTMECTSKSAPDFYAVFLLGTNGSPPSNYVQMSLVNADNSLISCTLKKTCPAIVLPAAPTADVNTNSVPDGYLNMPLMGPQPPWVVTLIFGGIGLFLERFVWICENNSTNPSPKASDGNLTLMQQVALNQQKNNSRPGTPKLADQQALVQKGQENLKL